MVRDGGVARATLFPVGLRKGNTMSITLLVGAPGHGKSYTMVKLFDEALQKGKPVATNLPLADDWAMVLAKRHTAFASLRKKALARKAEVYETMVFHSEDLEDLTRVRLSGEGEGRGIMLVDESHRQLNTRTLTAQVEEVTNKDGEVEAKPMKRAFAVAKRMKVIAHLSGHRHYGFDVVLATQDASNLDGQAKRLYEFVSEVRNFKKLPVVGSILRVNIFLRVTRWNDKARTKAGVSVYFLSKRLACLYQTHALQMLDWPADAIVLHPKGIPSTVGIPDSPQVGDVDINDYVDRAPGALSVEGDVVALTRARYTTDNTSDQRTQGVDDEHGIRAAPAERAGPDRDGTA